MIIPKIMKPGKGSGLFLFFQTLWRKPTDASDDLHQAQDKFDFAIASDTEELNADQSDEERSDPCGVIDLTQRLEERSGMVTGIPTPFEPGQ